MLTAAQLSAKQWFSWTRTETVIIALVFGVIMAAAFIQPAMWSGLAAGIGWLACLFAAYVALVWVEYRYLSRIDPLANLEEAAENTQTGHRVLFFCAALFSYIYFAFLLLASVIFIADAIAGTT
jgi:hypothetical protein